MRENIKIHSVTPATGWWAVYVNPDEEGSWRKERVVCWAAIEYQESAELYGKPEDYAPLRGVAGGWRPAAGAEVYAEVVGMIAGDGGLGIAADFPNEGFLAYFHEDDIDAKAEEEIRRCSVAAYQQKQRERGVL